MKGRGEEEEEKKTKEETVQSLGAIKRLDNEANE